MRVLILSQYYDPEPIPKPSEVAEGLRRRGHDVTVIAGLPNYPTGALYAGYHIVPWVHERVREIPVARVFEVPYHGRSAIGRVVNYLSFMTSAIVGGLFVARPDVIYVWHPPLTVAVAASVIGAFRRVPFVLDVQDIWPEAVISSGVLREGFLADVMRRLERFAYGRAQRILIVTNGAERNLLAKGVPQEKLVVLPNWIFGEVAIAPSSEDVRRARAELDADDAFIVTFAGNLGALQDLDTVLEASERLQRHPTKIAIRIIGDGSERKRLEHVARSKGLE
ncbi:MAG TPA: glycosyltransferase family 4 protein, partial [Candidatus Limnocylindria bacterium]|nr:glycosyltransferase family 4 protein [Candidatus Limnocylindria bacterium]